jgi:hypothetical protein
MNERIGFFDWLIDSIVSSTRASRSVRDDDERTTDDDDDGARAAMVSFVV